MLPNKRIAALIRQRRKEKHMTQLELGLAIGADQPTIARLETGARPPTVGQIMPLARVLNINPVSLVPTDAEKPDAQAPNQLQVAIELINEFGFIRPISKQTITLLLTEEWRVFQMQGQRLPTNIRPLAAAGDPSDIDLPANQEILRQLEEEDDAES